MRTPRQAFLPQTGGLTHTFWRAHNKSFLLQEHWVKDLFLKETIRALEHKSVNKEVGLQAYCLMDNHSHQLLSYKLSSTSLSAFMRIAHGTFGLKFNHLKKRQGAVAYDRPKTPLIQSGSKFHNLRTHFYIEANPLRAGIVKNVQELKRYLHCSYRFYAWGIKDEYSAHIEVADWYINLGKTDKQRQAKYRSLFDKYLKDFVDGFSDFMNTWFIGESFWQEFQKQVLRNFTQNPKNAGNPSVHPPPG